MNPSREQIEARLTALLLGELPADEAALLRYTIAQDAELKKLHDELAATIVLVREAEKTSADVSAEKFPALKLSEVRREKLLAHFKTSPPPDPLFWLKRIDVPRLVTVLACVALVGLVAAMFLPALASAKKKSQKISLANSARQKVLEEQIRLEDEKAAAALPAAQTAQTVTVATAPVVAPPPTEIVLPSSAPELALVDPATGLPIADGKAGVISQSIVGFASVPATGKPVELAIINGAGNRANGIVDDNSITKTREAEMRDRIAKVEPLGDSPRGSTASAGDTLAAYKFTTANSTLQPETPRAGGSGGGGGGGTPPSGNSTLSWFDSEANRSKTESAPKNAGEEYRRNVPTQTFASNSDFFSYFGLEEKLPTLAANEPARVNFETSQLDAKKSGPVLAQGLSDRDGLGVVARDKFYRLPERERQAINRSSAPIKPGSDFNAGNYLLADDAVAARSAGESKLTSDVPKDSFTTGLVKDDTAALRYRLTNNSDVGTKIASSDSAKQNDAGLNPNAPVVADASSMDSENAIKYQPYYAAKQKLAEMEELHHLLNSKITADQIDLAIPVDTMVQITAPAEPSKSQSFWQGLKGEYSSTAKIKVESEGGIVRGMNTPAATESAFDPYFVQTTFELIKSTLVLSNVVSELKLDAPSAPGNGGQRITKAAAMERLKSQLELQPVRNTKLISISATSSNPKEAAAIANAVAEAYRRYRIESNKSIASQGLRVFKEKYEDEEKIIRELKAEVARLEPKMADQLDKPLPKPAPNSSIPQPEILCRENNFSTFSLNVSDVSFKLAAASLERGQMPDAASIRTEEFINAFDYRDPEAAAGQPLAFAAERARYPFAQNRDLLRFSVKTAAAGRPAGHALNLVLLLDNSGSMERADRAAIIREALRVLTSQLQPQDTVSVVTFARTARLWADGVHGNEANEIFSRVNGITPEGGTNLEEAMRLAYETARRHYLANGMNRVVLLTDGAANLGNVSSAALKEKVEAQRKQGIALDCFGIGFEDYNDDLLEQLSSNGDGRYAFLNSPEDASKEFAAKLAGALQIAASDVKVQVEFNPQRVISYRQIGYAKHQLTKEQFRDNTVDAAEIAAQEAGNALYTVETKPDGIGPVATVRVRYRVPGTTDYRERSWNVDYAAAPALEQSSPAMRLAATASAFSEWLAASPFAQQVTLDELQKILNGVPQIYGADERPKKLETMLREAKSVAGK